MRCPQGAAAVGAAGSPRVKNVLISVLGLLQSPPQPPLPGQKNLSVSLLSEKYCLCSDKAAL